MYNLEQLCAEFQKLLPGNEQILTTTEATFYCLQSISYVFDKIVNVGYKGLLGACADKVNVQASENCWCDLDELCRRHPELRRSNVVSRKWRLANGFPCKGGYKCRQMYYEPDIVEWINQHLRGK